MGRVGPACRRFVRYYRNRVFRPFFHALPDNRLLRDRDTRLRGTGEDVGPAA